MSDSRLTALQRRVAAPARHLPSWPVLATLVLTAGSASAQQCLPPPPGAIYWLAGENSFDDQAGFHNGHSDGTGVSFVPGHVGTAMRFDGVDDRVYADVTLAEERAHAERFSYELWARPTAALAACPQSNSGTCGIGLHWAIFPRNGDFPAGSGGGAGIGVAIGTNGVCVGEHAAFLVDCLARINTAISDWTHVAVVIEDKTPRIYIDGALAHTGIASAKPFVFASWSVIGYAYNLGAFAGDLDEVTVYDRALGDDEIAALFAAGSAGKCKPECPAELTDDAWQGADVTGHTPLQSSSPDCLFGATDCSPEPTSILFANGEPDGTVHTVEWQTATPVTLGSFGLHASHDSVADPFRRFRHVSLQARMIGGTFETFYESPVVLPYGQGPDGRELLRCARLRPLRAQQFRAEFVQEGANSFSGPRVVELDGLIHDPIFSDDFE